MSTAPTCSACGGTEHLRGSPWHGSNLICGPCFAVWYDPDEAIDQTSPAEVGRLSLKLKAAGKPPWTGRYAPKPPAEPDEFDELFAVRAKTGDPLSSLKAMVAERLAEIRAAKAAGVPFKPATRRSTSHG